MDEVKKCEMKTIEKCCCDVDVPQEAIDRVRATFDVYWIIRGILERDKLPCIAYQIADEVMAEINKKYKIIPKERK